MTLKNTDDRWGAVSQLFHWVIVALILVMAYIGLTMGDLPNGPRKINIYALHKSIGLTILALVVLRVLWRVYAGAPAPVPGTPTWQQRIASVTHFLLYALLFAIPLSGWVLNSSAGYPLQWFKLFNLPAITGHANPGCRCGTVLQGKCAPSDCPLFGKVCTPLHPVGACMVSREGACSAYYLYGGLRS